MEDKYGMAGGWVKLDPKKAYSFLETMGDTNRDVTQTVVDDYASQMKAGLWRRNPQPIIFDKDKVMMDGQHRCWAVIESGVVIDAFVVHGMDREDVVALDHGKARTYKDDAHYMGWETNPMSASMAKFMVLPVGNSKKKIPSEVVHKWYEYYKASIDFAINLRYQTRKTRGKDILLPMAAAIARAHAAGTDPALLTRFGEILKTGQIDVAADMAAAVLRDAWLMGRLGTTRTEQYLKTEAALRAFIDRRAIRTLQRAAGELFAIKAIPRTDGYNALDTRNSPRVSKKARTMWKAGEVAKEAAPKVVRKARVNGARAAV